MDNKAEQTTDYDRMVSVLQQFCPAETRRSPRKIETIFNQVLKTARTSDKWLDKETDRVVHVAGMIFVDADDATQAMTFAFMKNLINVFRKERNETVNGSKDTVITKLFRFYFSAVLLYSNKPSLLTKASRHAEECIRDAQLDRSVVLGALEVSLFEKYRVGRYEKEAAKNLLKILKQKMSCHGDTEAMMPGTMYFIEKVCADQNSCGTVILVCGVLEDLLASLISWQACSDFDMSETYAVSRWIISHMDHFRFRNKCWEAIARFTKAVFLSGYNFVSEALLIQGVFSRIHYMLRDNRDILLIELLGAVSAACEIPRVNHYLVSANVFLQILPIVENGHASKTVRLEACKAFSVFLRNAFSGDVFSAVKKDLIGAVVKLLKSSDELAVTSALRWILDIQDRCEEIDRGKEIRCLLIAAKVDRTLFTLRTHPNGSIRTSAQDVRCRLYASTLKNVSHLRV